MVVGKSWSGIAASCAAIAAIAADGRRRAAAARAAATNFQNGSGTLCSECLICIGINAVAAGCGVASVYRQRVLRLTVGVGVASVIMGAEDGQRGTLRDADGRARAGSAAGIAALQRDSAADHQRDVGTVRQRDRTLARLSREINFQILQCHGNIAGQQVFACLRAGKCRITGDIGVIVSHLIHCDLVGIIGTGHEETVPQVLLVLQVVRLRVLAVHIGVGGVLRIALRQRGGRQQCRQHQNGQQHGESFLHQIRHNTGTSSRGHCRFAAGRHGVSQLARVPLFMAFILPRLSPDAM